jgi:hypothetical protein
MAVRSANRLFLLVALLAGVGLVIFGKLVPPQGILAPALFLLILFIALLTGLTPLAQIIGARLVRSPSYRQHSLRHALRQAALLSAASIANLLLLLLHAWLWADLVLIALALILIELITLARK